MKIYAFRGVVQRLVSWSPKPLMWVRFLPPLPKFILKLPILAFFLVRSSSRRASQEENANLNNFNYEFQETEVNSDFGFCFYDCFAIGLRKYQSKQF